MNPPPPSGPNEIPSPVPPQIGVPDPAQSPAPSLLSDSSLAPATLTQPAIHRIADGSVDLTLGAVNVAIIVAHHPAKAVSNDRVVACIDRAGNTRLALVDGVGDNSWLDAQHIAERSVEAGIEGQRQQFAGSGWNPAEGRAKLETAVGRISRSGCCSYAEFFPLSNGARVEWTQAGDTQILTFSQRALGSYAAIVEENVGKRELFVYTPSMVDAEHRASSLPTRKRSTGAFPS